MLGGIESLRASGNFASPRESGRGRGEAAGAGVGRVGPEVPAGLRGRRAKRGGRGARPRERARLPRSLALAAAGRGNRTVTGVATPGFHGRVKPIGALAPPLGATPAAPGLYWPRRRQIFFERRCHIPGRGPVARCVDGTRTCCGLACGRLFRCVACTGGDRHGNRGAFRRVHRRLGENDF